MKQITDTKEANAMKAKVTRTKIAVAAGTAVLAAGLASPLGGIIIPERKSPSPHAAGVIVNKNGCSRSTSSCPLLDG